MSAPTVGVSSALSFGLRGVIEMFNKVMLSALAAGVLAQGAAGQVRITEWMYQGANGEFIEFTNLGPDPVNMAGWSFDDDSRIAGVIDLSGFGVLQPGQSAILTDAVAADFMTAWGLAGVPVIGGNSAGLSRNDEINLFDNFSVLVARLTYGDQNIVGTPRAQNRSVNIPLADYGVTTAQTTWVLSTVGDGFGSRASTGADVGTPGTATIPGPGAAVLALAWTVVAGRRRR
ncbi:MAG: lamin tail domain-containing protein [Phycisphaerales bacterium]